MLPAILTFPLRTQDSAPAEAKVRAEHLKAGMHAEVKVKEGAGGVLEVTDIELHAPGEKDSVLGPIERVGQAEIVILGIVISIDEKTEWFDSKGNPVRAGALPAGANVKVDLSRGKLDAKRVREVEAGRRAALSGTLTISEDSGGGARRFVVFERELRVRSRVKVDLSEAARGKRLEALQQSAGGGRRGRRKDEDVTRGLLQLGEWGSLGGTVDWRGESRGNPTLDSNRNRDELRSRVRARLEMTARPADDLLLVAGVKGEQEDRDIHGKDNIHEFTAKPDEVFAQAESIFNAPIDVLVGRSRFEDDREWLYNRNLDGVRLFYQKGAVAAEGSVTTGFDTGVRLDNRTVNRIGTVEVAVAENTHISGYVIDCRDPTSADVSPFYYGLRSAGRPARGFEYWLELAAVSGVDHTNRIRGQAFDAGATWTLDAPLKPNFTIGWAWASGDDDSTDRVDRAFRQTGFQRNNGKFAGVTSFRYYGEVLDPELSNLQIVTIGAGACLARRTSIDLVGHTYFQDEPSAKLGSNDLKASSNGRDRFLGIGADAILGIRELDALDVELVLGWFDPGPGFDTNQTAYTAKLQLRLKF